MFITELFSELISSIRFWFKSYLSNSICQEQSDVGEPFLRPKTWQIGRN